MRPAYTERRKSMYHDFILMSFNISEAIFTQLQRVFCAGNKTELRIFTPVVYFIFSQSPFAMSPDYIAYSIIDFRALCHQAIPFLLGVHRCSLKSGPLFDLFTKFRNGSDSSTDTSQFYFCNIIFIALNPWCAMER